MRANIPIIKVLFLIALFFMSSTIPLRSLEKGISSCFFVFKREQKVSERSFFLEIVKSKPLSRDLIKEYSYDGGVPKRLEEFPKHLVHYVLSRLEFINNQDVPKAFREIMSSLELKAISNQSKHYLKIPSSVFVVAVPLDLDFKIKYKGIKKTKEERLPLPLNYHAREFEIIEGFEAGETLFSTFSLNPYWKIVSRIGIFEKWETEKLEYEEAHHIETAIDHQMVAERFTGTVKYALGCVFDVKMKHERKMTLEFLMQQTAHSQWKANQFLFSERKPSGILFDHWIATFTFDF